METPSQRVQNWTLYPSLQDCFLLCAFTQEILWASSHQKVNKFLNSFTFIIPSNQHVLESSTPLNLLPSPYSLSFSYNSQFFHLLCTKAFVLPSTGSSSSLSTLFLSEDSLWKSQPAPFSPLRVPPAFQCSSLACQGPKQTAFCLLLYFHLWLVSRIHPWDWSFWTTCGFLNVRASFWASSKLVNPEHLQDRHLPFSNGSSSISLFVRVPGPSSRIWKFLFCAELRDNIQKEALRVSSALWDSMRCPLVSPCSTSLEPGEGWGKERKEDGGTWVGEGGEGVKGNGQKKEWHDMKG